MGNAFIIKYVFNYQMEFADFFFDQFYGNMKKAAVTCTRAGGSFLTGKLLFDAKREIEAARLEEQTNHSLSKSPNLKDLTPEQYVKTKADLKAQHLDTGVYSATKTHNYIKEKVPEVLIKQKIISH